MSPRPPRGRRLKDPLLLGLTVKELRRVYNGILPDHPLCTPPPLVGEVTPTNQAEAQALAAKLEEAGGDLADPFKTPAYRILTDERILKRLGEFPSGTPIGEFVKRHLNGYDGLEVRVGSSVYDAIRFGLYLECMHSLRRHVRTLTCRPFATPSTSARRRTSRTSRTAPSRSSKVTTGSAARASSSRGAS